MPGLTTQKSTSLHPALQWIALVALSVVLAALLMLVRLPAARLLGPMIAAIIVATTGGTIRLPMFPRYGSQAIIGCLIAGTVTPAIVGTFLTEWPLFLAVTLSIIGASSVLGWIMSKARVMPGTTAIWGLAPGAASAMMMIGEAYGADARLVAFMQYVRVAFVVGAASIVSRFWLGGGGEAHSEIEWFGAVDWIAFAETMAIALFGSVIGRISRIPAGPVLMPMFIGSALHATGLVAIELPEWLLSISYAFLGWSIGLSFTRAILLHAFRIFPQTVLALLVLIGFSGCLAVILVETLSIDPLTAYLATSPGGIDSIAIIGTSSKVDLSFVMALQVVRMLMVLTVGPSISRLVAGSRDKKAPPEVGHQSPPPSPDSAEIIERVREDESDLD